MIARHDRLGQLICLALTAVMIGASFYFEYGLGVLPCPLCLMQRACLCLLFILALVAVCKKTMHRPGFFFYAQTFFSLSGAYFAIRQLWLVAHHDPNLTTCLPTLDLMIRYFPLKEIFRALLFGSAADCSHEVATFLTLSIPTWSLIAFIIVLINNTFFYFLSRQKPS